ncbi:MAG: hypothetical protein ACRYG8_32690 [Janthinobacterium lividum]
MLKLTPMPYGSTADALVAGGLPREVGSVERQPHTRQRHRWWPRATRLLAQSETPHRLQISPAVDTISASQRTRDSTG